MILLVILALSFIRETSPLERDHLFFWNSAAGHLDKNPFIDYLLTCTATDLLWYNNLSAFQ